MYVRMPEITGIIAGAVLITATVTGNTALAQQEIDGYPRSGTYRSDKGFSGALPMEGCRSTQPGRISGGVADGRIKGRLRYSAMERGSPNDYEKSKMKGEVGPAYDFEIRADGTFGSYDRQDGMFLRAHRSGQDKLQWIKGRVDSDGNIFVDIKMGVPDHSPSTCFGRGVFVKLADQSAEEKAKGIAMRQDEAFSNTLFRYKSGGNCAGRDGKDAARMAYQSLLQYRKKRDTDKNAAMAHVAEAVEKYFAVGETAAAMSCKEFALDQFRLIKRTVRRLDMPDVNSRVAAELKKLGEE